MSFPRVRCYSEFKHVLRRHDNLGCYNNSYGSIFNHNTTYNINTGCHGGFWGGFAHGLGAGIGGFLGGIFGNFMGGFGFGGGFGMGGFGFGGFPSFGMGNIFGGGWGNGGSGFDFGFGNNAGGVNSSSNNTSNTSSRTSRKNKNNNAEKTTKSTAKGAECTDADDKIINDYAKEINDTNTPLTQDRAKALYKAISDLAKKPKDTEHEDQNKVAYEGLLGKLKELANNNKWVLEPKSGEDPVNTPVAPEANNTVPSGAGDGSPKTDVTPATPPATVTPTETGTEAGALDKTETKILTDMGCRIDDTNHTITLPSELTVENLKTLADLSQKANLAVKVAHNPKAADDQWIAGEIDNIEIVDGTLKFTIDCASVGRYEYKYSVVQQKNDNNMYSIDLHQDSEKKCSSDGRTHESQLYKFNSGTRQLERNGNTVIHKG